MLYIFENSKLVGIQKTENWSTRHKYKAILAAESIGRTGEISDKGRGICAYCLKDLGPRDLPPGKVSHGICPECLTIEKEKIEGGEI